ncbi:MAG: hypothetical protein K2O58_10390 [Bacteroidales bacterium]|nr:hypothetical protein [Bacteroidales bacterium]MDE6872311.1 hypothetical protein [Bacteroidales bacterium]MDE7128276.1 hypothetical protein [Bacteroidales bacterium]
MLKDTLITSRAKCRELMVFAGCFAAACAANVYAIAVYRTSWSELFTQIGYVAIISVVLYLLCWIVRLAVRLVIHVRRILK